MTRRSLVETHQLIVSDAPTNKEPTLPSNMFRHTSACFITRLRLHCLGTARVGGFIVLAVIFSALIRWSGDWRRIPVLQWPTLFRGVFVNCWKAVRVSQDGGAESVFYSTFYRYLGYIWVSVCASCVYGLIFECVLPRVISFSSASRNHPHHPLWSVQTADAAADGFIDRSWKSQLVKLMGEDKHTADSLLRHVWHTCQCPLMLPVIRIKGIFKEVKF